MYREGMNIFSEDENRMFVSSLNGRILSNWRDNKVSYRVYKTDEGLVLSVGPIDSSLGRIYLTDLLEDINVHTHDFSDRTRMKIVEARLGS